jgi:hypothetical protein
MADPTDTYARIAIAGIKKCNAPLSAQVVQGFMAGECTAQAHGCLYPHKEGVAYLTRTKPPFTAPLSVDTCRAVGVGVGRRDIARSLCDGMACLQE